MVKYYCFNKDCRISIYNSEEYIAENIPIKDALNKNILCPECLNELVSDIVLDTKLNVKKIFQNFPNFKSVVIDDDPMFHFIVKTFFKNFADFKEVKHFLDGPSALNHLFENRNFPDLIPDLMFIDVNMPGMDAWNFLSEFDKLYPTFNKKVILYLVSAYSLPEYKDKIQNYSYIKGVIEKPFNKDLMQNILLDFI